MAIRSGFFNSVNGDRKYDAKRFAEYFSSLIGNGVFPNPSSGLQVVANDDMSITVKPGKAWINGYIMINDDDYILQIEPADGVLNRIDRVVVRYDTADREIRLEVKKGTFASTPIAPELQRNADAYELALADVYVAAGAISITQANITDLRLNSELCSIVHGTVEQVDTTTLFNQYLSWYQQTTEQAEADLETMKQQFQVDTTTLFNQYLNWYQQTTEQAEADLETMKQQFQAEFDAWFAGLKDILDENTAGNLFNLINQVESDLASHKNDKAAHIDYATADGTDTYAVEIPGITAYVEGMSLKIKFQNANTGPSTLNINGLGDIAIKKSNGNDLSAGYIKSGRVYHLVYDGVNFQLLGEGGEGTARPEHVLEGYTFTNDEDTFEGTMPNQGQVIITPGQVNIAIPYGFHNGEGYVEGSPNLSAENIKEGVNIFGVVGTLKEALVYTSETYYETIANKQYVYIYCPFIPDYFRVIVANQPLPSQYEGRKIFYKEWCHRADLVIDPYPQPDPTLGYFSRDFFEGSPNAIDMSIDDWGSWQLVEGQYRNRLRFRLGIPATLNNCYVYLVAIKGI